MSPGEANSPSPPAAQPPLGSPDRPVTIQLTRKRYKALILLGAAFMLAGLALACADLARHFEHPDRMGLLLAVGGAAFGIGLMAALAGRLLAWWHHG
ncbi:MAG: hypothetical protein IBJ11_02085 [Phycisphaerales bacterium]|nr:hypothetical protein [Phycisphaerales bacterium]